MRKARKGISPIIATVLLILIAIATGILIYAFANGWIGGRLSSGTGPNTVLVVEEGYYVSNTTGKGFILYVRNDGGVQVNITSAYVTAPNGEVYYVSAKNISTSLKAAVSTGGKGVVITPGNVQTVVVAQPSGLTVTKGYIYKITLVTTGGVEVTYSIRAPTG